MKTQFSDRESVSITETNLSQIPHESDILLSDSCGQITSGDNGKTNDTNQNTIKIANVNIEQSLKMKELELNGFLILVFLLWIVVGFISSLGSLLDHEGSYFVDGINSALTSVGIIAIIGMWNKKKWGLILCVIFFLLQLIPCLILAGIDVVYLNEAIVIVIKMIMMSLFLCLRKNKHSAYYTIWHNGYEPSHNIDTTNSSTTISTKS